LKRSKIHQDPSAPARIVLVVLLVLVLVLVLERRSERPRPRTTTRTSTIYARNKRAPAESAGALEISETVSRDYGTVTLASALSGEPTPMSTVAVHV